MKKLTARQQELAEKRRFWKEQIDTWKCSGLKQSEYCRRHQLKVHRFVYWKKKFKEPKAPSASFVQIYPPKVFQSHPGPRPTPLRLLVGGYTIEVTSGFDPVTLKQLVLTLGQL